MNRISLYDQIMRKITIKELLVISVNWTLEISKFYADFREETDDVSFIKLLTTMIDQEGQYTEYYEENLGKLDFQLDFGTGVNEVFDFKGGSDSGCFNLHGNRRIFYLVKQINYLVEVNVFNFQFSILLCEFFYFLFSQGFYYLCLKPKTVERLLKRRDDAVHVCQPDFLFF